MDFGYENPKSVITNTFEIELFRAASRRFLEAVGDPECNKKLSLGPKDNVTWPQQAAPTEFNKIMVPGGRLDKRIANVDKQMAKLQAAPPGTVQWACERDKTKIAADWVKFLSTRLQTLLKYAEMNTLANPAKVSSHAAIKAALEQLPGIVGKANQSIQAAETASGLKTKFIGITTSNKGDLKYDPADDEAKKKKATLIASQIEKASHEIFKDDPEALKQQLQNLEAAKKSGEAAVEEPHDEPGAPGSAAPEPSPAAEPGPTPEPAPELSPIQKAKSLVNMKTPSTQYPYGSGQLDKMREMVIKAAQDQGYVDVGDYEDLFDGLKEKLPHIDDADLDEIIEKTLSSISVNSINDLDPGNHDKILKSIEGASDEVDARNSVLKDHGIWISDMGSAMSAKPSVPSEAPPPESEPEAAPEPEPEPEPAPATEPVAVPAPKPEPAEPKSIYDTDEWKNAADRRIDHILTLLGTRGGEIPFGAYDEYREKGKARLAKTANELMTKALDSSGGAINEEAFEEFKESLEKYILNETGAKSTKMSMFARNAWHSLEFGGPSAWQVSDPTAWGENRPYKGIYSLSRGESPEIVEPEIIKGSDNGIWDIYYDGDIFDYAAEHAPEIINNPDTNKIRKIRDILDLFRDKFAKNLGLFGAKKFVENSLAAAAGYPSSQLQESPYVTNSGQIAFYGTPPPKKAPEKTPESAPGVTLPSGLAAAAPIEPQPILPQSENVVPPESYVPDLPEEPAPLSPGLSLLLKTKIKDKIKELGGDYDDLDVPEMDKLVDYADTYTGSPGSTSMNQIIDTMHEFRDENTKTYDQLTEVEKSAVEAFAISEFWVDNAEFNHSLFVNKGFWLAGSDVDLVFSKAMEQNKKPKSNLETLSAEDKVALHKHGKSHGITEAWSVPISKLNVDDIKSSVADMLRYIAQNRGHTLTDADIDALSQKIVDSNIDLSFDELGEDQQLMAKAISDKVVASKGPATKLKDLSDVLKDSGIAHINPAGMRELLSRSFEDANIEPEADQEGLLSAIKSLLSRVPETQPVGVTYGGVESSIDRVAADNSSMPTFYDVLHDHFIKGEPEDHIKNEIAKSGLDEATKRLSIEGLDGLSVETFDDLWNKGTKLNESKYVGAVLNRGPDMAKHGAFAKTFKKLTSGVSLYDRIKMTYESWRQRLEANDQPIPEAFKSSIVKHLLDNMSKVPGEAPSMPTWVGPLLTAPWENMSNLSKAALSEKITAAPPEIFDHIPFDQSVLAAIAKKVHTPNRAFRMDQAQKALLKHQEDLLSQASAVPAQLSVDHVSSVSDITGLDKDFADGHFSATQWANVTDIPPIDQALKKAVDLSGGMPPDGAINALAKIYNIPASEMKSRAGSILSSGGPTSITYGGKKQYVPSKIVDVLGPPPAQPKIAAVIGMEGNTVTSTDQLSKSQLDWLKWQISSFFGHRQVSLGAEWDWSVDARPVLEAFEHLPTHKVHGLKVSPELVASLHSELNSELSRSPDAGDGLTETTEQILGKSLAELEADLDFNAHISEPPTSFGSKEGGYHSGGGAAVEEGGVDWMWMYKSDPHTGASPTSIAAGEVAATRIAGLLGFPAPAEMFISTKSGRKVSMQKFIHHGEFGRGRSDIWSDPSRMQDVKDLQRIHILTWITSNHDAHGGNIIRLTNPAPGQEGYKDRLVPIDFGQAGKFIGSADEALNIDYNPNNKMGESAPEANQMFKAWSRGESVPLVPLNDPEIMDIFKRLEAIPEDIWKRFWTPYGEESVSLFPQFQQQGKTPDSIVEAFAQRRRSARADVAKFYRDIIDRRVQSLNASDPGAERAKLLKQLGVEEFEKTLLTTQTSGADVEPPEAKPEIKEGDLYLHLSPEDQAIRNTNGIPKWEFLKDAGLNGHEMLVHDGGVVGRTLKFFTVGDQLMVEGRLKPKAAKRLESLFQDHETSSNAYSHTNYSNTPEGKAASANSHVVDGDFEKHINYWKAGLDSAVKKPVDELGNKIGNVAKLKYIHRSLKKAQELAESPDPIKRAAGEHYLEQFKKAGKKPMGSYSANVASGGELSESDYRLDDTLTADERTRLFKPFVVPPELLTPEEPDEPLHDKLPKCQGLTNEGPCTERLDYMPIPSIMANSVRKNKISEPENLHKGEYVGTKDHSALQSIQIPTGYETVDYISDRYSHRNFKIKLGNGAALLYSTYFAGANSSSKNSALHHRGYFRLEFDKDKETNDQSIADVMKSLSSIGIDVSHATREDAELEYLRNLGWSLHLHDTSPNHNFVPSGDTTSEKIESYINEIKSRFNWDPRLKPKKADASSTSKALKGKIIGSYDEPNPDYNPVPLDMGNGYGWDRPDISSEEIDHLRNKGIVIFATTSGTLYPTILSNSFASFNHRLVRGAPFPGMSNNEDLGSGGSNNTYFYIGDKNEGISPGSTAIVLDVGLLKFTKAFGASHDSYGSMTLPGDGGSYGYTYVHQRLTKDLSEAVTNETVDKVFKTGSLDYKGGSELMIGGAINVGRWLVRCAVPDKNKANRPYGKLFVSDPKTGNAVHEEGDNIEYKEMIEALVGNLKHRGETHYGAERTQVLEEDPDKPGELRLVMHGDKPAIEKIIVNRKESGYTGAIF